jgi:hypothetical protein
MTTAMEKMNMTGSRQFAMIAISAAIIASSGVNAFAKTDRSDARADRLDAHAQATRGLPQTEMQMEIRKECYAEANKRWPSSNQEMQTVRDFAYRTCAFERGVNNP